VSRRAEHSAACVWTAAKFQNLTFTSNPVSLPAGRHSWVSSLARYNSIILLPIKVRGKINVNFDKGDAIMEGRKGTALQHLLPLILLTFKLLYLLSS